MAKSPKPKPKPKKELTFVEAIGEVLMGKSVTRLEWADKEFHVLLDNKFLRLHKPDGKYYDLIVHEDDMRNEDWVVI